MIPQSFLLTPFLLFSFVFAQSYETLGYERVQVKKPARIETPLYLGIVYADEDLFRLLPVADTTYLLPILRHASDSLAPVQRPIPEALYVQASEATYTRAPNHVFRVTKDADGHTLLECYYSQHYPVNPSKTTYYKTQYSTTYWQQYWGPYFYRDPFSSIQHYQFTGGYGYSPPVTTPIDPSVYYPSSYLKMQAASPNVQLPFVPQQYWWGR